MLKWDLPINLNGATVKLVPLEISHLSGLIDAVNDGKLWELWYTTVPTLSKMESEIKRRLQLQSDGAMVPFTIMNRDTNEILGMTTFCRIDNVNMAVEIGYTWYRKSCQKTHVNTESKLLLLQYAFETLKCNRVEFRTSQFNFESRRAIERLGAKLDGILRMSRIHGNGAVGDSYVYSIIASEWSAVKANLEYKLASYKN